MACGLRRIWSPPSRAIILRLTHLMSFSPPTINAELAELAE